jgi:hypothetical protein
MDRRQEPALLESVLVEDEASGADDGENIDGPVVEDRTSPPPNSAVKSLTVNAAIP